MKEERLQAIILKAIPFRDKQSIITLLSKERGVVSMIVKGLNKTRPHLTACITPLAESEFIYREGRSDLLSCLDASLIDPHLALREKYSFLQTAMQLAKALLDTQYPAKPSTTLYILLSRFLKQIPLFGENISTLKCCFILKLLKHEGLLPQNHLCVVCQEEKSIFYHEEGMFCHKHRPMDALLFQKQEWSILENLANASCFSSLKEILLAPLLEEKIEQILQRNNLARR